MPLSSRNKSVDGGKGSNCRNTVPLRQTAVPQIAVSQTDVVANNYARRSYLIYAYARLGSCIGECGFISCHFHDVQHTARIYLHHYQPHTFQQLVGPLAFRHITAILPIVQQISFLKSPDCQELQQAIIVGLPQKDAQ